MEQVALEVKHEQPKKSHIQTSQPKALLKLIDIALAPGKTMQYLTDRPDWKTPLIIILLCTALFAATMATSTLHNSINQVDKVSIGSEMAMLGLLTIVLLAALTAVSSWLMFSTLLFFLGKVVTGRGTFRQTFSTVGFASLPNALKCLVLGGAVLLTGRYDYCSGLQGVFPNVHNTYLTSLLSSLDVFNAWCVVLTTLAFSSTFKLSKGKSATLILSLWGLEVLTKGAMASLLP